MAHDQGTERPSIAFERAIAFHADDAIDNGELRRARQGDVDDAVVDAAPVEFIFRPAVADAGDGAEEVFERQRGAGPVMRLQLR